MGARTYEISARPEESQVPTSCANVEINKTLCFVVIFNFLIIAAVVTILVVMQGLPKSGKLI